MRRSVDLISGKEVSFFYRKGSGPALVMLHGLCGSGSYFDLSYEYPGLLNNELLAIDLPGFGESSKIDEWSVDGVAEVICSVLQYKNIRWPWVVAHSMSSSIAVRLLDEISGLVLIEGNLLPSHLDFSDRILRSGREEYSVEYGRLKQLAPILMRQQTRLSEDSKLKHYGASYQCCSSEVVWDAARECNADIRSGFPLRRLAKWRSPLILFYGDESGYADTTSEISGVLPDAEMYLIRNSGHFPMLDNPSDTYDALSRIMEKYRNGKFASH